jgi:biopolymer transport protein ExbD
VIFIVTAPLLTHSVKIELPKASSTPNLTHPDNIQLGIQADGTVYWNGEAVAVSELPQRMKTAAGAVPLPELHIRADASVQYRNVAHVMSAAARAGLVKIGFVTTPDEQR